MADKTIKKADVCIECAETPAVWVRHTQFAGDHPYCDSCAHKERDFGQSDSTFDWELLLIVPKNKTINELFEEFMAEFDTPEYRKMQDESEAKYNAMPCKYDISDECYVHGYYPPRPCGHTCMEVPCVPCELPGAH